MQDEWQGATRLRFTLRGQCAHCCGRMRIRCTRLPIPAATRVHSGCADFRTTACADCRGSSRRCGAAWVMDVLSVLMHRWRWAAGHTFRFVRRSGGISVNCQRQTSHKRTCRQVRLSSTVHFRRRVRNRRRVRERDGVDRGLSTEAIPVVPRLGGTQTSGLKRPTRKFTVAHRELRR